ncbi:MAG: sulfurtransferase, partial [Chloroflexi bacterium]|nr:sulfurtransferase [Chloroflexota bacterium]
MNIPPLVTTDWLAQHLNDETIRVADVRWYLRKDKNGFAEYLNGHIPGAIFFDLDRDLSAPPGQGPGRHPLPTIEQFGEVVARAGIRAETHVIAYDDSGGGTAARLWWLLRYFGFARVSLLDGGITRWIAEGRAVQTEIPRVPRGGIELTPHPDWVVDQARVNDLRADTRALVLDARLAERYAGLIEPIDARAGHIPGARNAPLAGNLRGADDLRFKPAADLRARFDALGAGR